MAMKGNIFAPELEDDQQVALLYAPFRPKELNPLSWNRKLKFWENMLFELALDRKLVTFDLQTLPQMFDRNGLLPRCLDTVVEELIKSGKVISIEHYTTSNSWLSWGFDRLIKKPVLWGVGHLIGSSKPKSTVYVWTEVVKNLSEQLAEQHGKKQCYGLATNLISVADLKSSCSDFIISDQDFEILLLQMEWDRRIAAAETKDKEKLVKFCRKQDKTVEPITELEHQVYYIQRTAKALEQNISKCSSESQRFIEEARKNLREGSKFKARQCLKKKNAILKLLEKKMATLENLHTILEQIEDAKSNEMIVRACESGLAALKSLNKDSNLDKVESLMEDIQEVVESQDDLSNMLSNIHLSEESTEELESELKELLKDDLNVIVGHQENLDDLPDVPTHSVSRDLKEISSPKPSTAKQALTS